MDDTAVNHFFDKNEEFTEGTKVDYLKALKKYSEYLGMMPQQFISEAKQEQKSIQSVTDRAINDRIALFPARLKHLAPKTKQNIKSHIRVFHIDHDIILPQGRKKRLNIEPLEENHYIPTKEEVITAIKSTNSTRNAAIIMLQCTSCLGMSEIINLKIKNMSTDDEGISTFTCKRQKTKYKFTTFCTPEATEMIQLYLKERNSREDTKVTGEEDYLFITDEFKGNRHMTQHSLMCMYRNLNDKMQLERKGKFYSKIRSHNMRKYGNQCLRDAGVALGYIDYISGRKESEVHAAYHDWARTDLKEVYRSHMAALSLLNVVQVVSNQDLYNALNEVKFNYQIMYEEFQAMKDREEEVNRKASAIVVYETAKKAGVESVKKMAVDKMK